MQARRLQEGDGQGTGSEEHLTSEGGDGSSTGVGNDARGSGSASNDGAVSRASGTASRSLDLAVGDLSNSALGHPDL